MSDKDGGSAFPCEQHETADGTWNQSFDPGMSLRDYLAAKAMHQFLHGSVLPPEFNAGEALRHVAKRAYEAADAMIEARQA